MPVLARPSIVITPPPSLRPAISWTDPDGNLWNLSDLTLTESGVIATSISGIGAPPAAMTTVPLPSGDVYVQSLLPQPHQITLGLYAEGNNPSQFHSLVSSISRAFWTVRRNQPAQGILTIRQQDGSARQIGCYVTSGQDQPDDPYPLLQATWTLTLQGDPYWTDTEPQPPVAFASADFTGAGGSLPLLTIVGGFNSAVTITNDGDAEAYPVWTVYGPCSITMTNATTGLSWSFANGVPAGDVWTVTSAPDGNSTVVDQNGNSQWSQLVAGIPRTLWTLIPGNNEVIAQLYGTTSDSGVVLQYTRRWLRG